MLVNKSREKIVNKQFLAKTYFFFQINNKSDEVKSQYGGEAKNLEIRET